MTFYKKKCDGSSMDWARSMIDSAPDGAIFLADEYTAARGQHGRIWKLYPGQLILTVLLKPKIELAAVQDGFMQAVAATLSDFLPVTVTIKLPNDFLLRGKKIGGMLTEAIWHGDTLRGVVIGLALNCNNRFEKSDPLFQTATSIIDVTGRNINIDALRTELLCRFDKWYKASSFFV